MQGLTLKRLILSVCVRVVQPFLALTGFYVWISRLTTYGGIRLLQQDKKAIKGLTTLRWPDPLYAWDHGYRDGRWDEALAAAALKKAHVTSARLEVARVAAKKVEQAAAARARAAAYRSGPGGRGGGGEYILLIQPIR